MNQYFDTSHSDEGILAADVVFTDMNTGVEHRGPEGVAAMMQHIYQVAFQAVPEARNLVISDGQAVLEADFKGKHTGEFMGIAATGRQVNVPLCVVYDLENDQIKAARIYLAAAVMLRQLGAGE